MGKFRSKLKRNVKGKNWSHGHSSTANPENQKHRDRAKSRYFRADLSLAPQENINSKTGLTLQSVLRHDAQQSMMIGSEPTVNDIANSIKSFNIDGGDDMTESQGVTFKTFQTFASNWSQCTNASFSKLMTRFRGDSQHHKEMLAILAAATELIKERGGTQSSTEYFLILMETLEATTEITEIASTLSLLCLGIKSVPEPVLRKKFSEGCQHLIELMEKFIETDNQNVLRNIIGILSVFLRAQEYAIWRLSSTLKIFNTILTFITHTKPKIRKAAQHAITSIVLGSSFMIHKDEEEDGDEMNDKNKICAHPASSIITKYCIDCFSVENMARNQTVILHVLGMLKTIIGGLRGDDIKSICESLLSMMTASNVLIRTNCFHTIHSLFGSPKVNNLNATLIGKLLTALYDYQPDRSDTRQMLAWITVLKQGHLCLNKLDPNLCVGSTVRFVEICTSQLWNSERIEIKNATTHTLKDILLECVQPVSTDGEAAARNAYSIKKIIASITKCLLSPFGQSIKDTILILSVLFEVTGEYFPDELIETVKTLGDQYDTQTSLRVQIEHAIIAAIGSIGPERILKVIPIHQNYNFILDRSWLMPLLREGVTGSSFEYFTSTIVPLASQCNQNWEKYKKEKNLVLSHTYELLCCQLWGLFPGFCRQPSDPENFKMIAKTLGTIISDHPDLRAPVLDGLKELIVIDNEPMQAEMARYSKNFMPRLLNLYTTKPNGTYENEIREKCIDVIRNYLRVTPAPVLEELFESGMDKLKQSKPGTFLGDSVFDIVEIVALFQSRPKLKIFYEKYISVILKQKRNPDIVAAEEIRIRKQQKKCYSILSEIMLSENQGCRDFMKTMLDSIEKLLVATHSTTVVGARIARVRCIYTFLQIHQNLTSDREILKTIIPESILVLHEFPKINNISQHIIHLVGDIYQNENKLNDLVDTVIVGFTSDDNLIANTILTLKIIVNHLTGNLTVNTIEFILDQISVFLVSKNRKHVEASLSFLVTFVRVLPSPIVATHLEKIVRSLSAMVPDTKRFCRIQYGYVLKRLCKRFDAKEIIKLVPGNDLITHKRLKRIRKMLAREKRKEHEKTVDDNDGDAGDDDGETLEQKSYTIDEILADSDSDTDDLNSTDDEMSAGGKRNTGSGKPAAKRRRKDETYIQEEPESIVDLADLNAIGKITTSRPDKIQTNGGSSAEPGKRKDPNRGFKTAEDGRLIINDDSTDDDDDGDSGAEMKSNAKPSNKKGILDDMETDDDDEDEMFSGPGPNKKSVDSRSVRSGRTATTSATRYTAGGKGIHRNTTAESVKSGISNASTVLKRKVPGSGRNEFGGQYKAKKASGDLKMKGQLDPYAYIPLNRSDLNKRKKAKSAGQFKSIVKGARKGAAAGSKSKLRKAMMMSKK